MSVANSLLEALELIYEMIQNDHEDGDGGTVFVGKEHEAGYVVGLSGVVIPATEPLPGIEQFCHNMLDELRGLKPETVGYWIDSGDIFVDFGVVISDHDSADRLGHAFGQLSIYDIESGEVVWI